MKICLALLVTAGMQIKIIKWYFTPTRMTKIKKKTWNKMCLWGSWKFRHPHTFPATLENNRFSKCGTYNHCMTQQFYWYTVQFHCRNKINHLPSQSNHYNQRKFWNSPIIFLKDKSRFYLGVSQRRIITFPYQVTAILHFIFFTMEIEMVISLLKTLWQHYTKAR